MSERLVVYDTFFGNTEKIAKAMAEAIDGEAKKVSDLQREDLDGIQILIAGSPTRAFRPTPAMVAWLKSLRGELSGVRGGVFDTRIRLETAQSGFLRFLIRIFGYADATLAKLMTQTGATLALPSEGFGVVDSEGPLIDGEQDRAQAWARGILQS